MLYDALYFNPLFTFALCLAYIHTFTHTIVLRGVAALDKHERHIFKAKHFTKATNLTLLRLFVCVWLCVYFERLLHGMAV